MDYGFDAIDSVVQASMNRVVALWYGDVDRISLDGVKEFTGASAFYSVYDLTGLSQYYLTLFQMNGKIFHTWRLTPGNVKQSACLETEKNVLNLLKQQGIVLMPVLPSTATYQAILKKLPLLIAMDDKTPCVGDFQIQALTEQSGVTLSANDRNALKSFLTIF